MQGNDHGAEIAQFALRVRRGLNLFVEDKDERSWFEVKVTNGGGKTVFEVGDRCNTTLENLFVHNELFFSFGSHEWL